MNYELKNWVLEEGKTIIKLEGENKEEQVIEINNTYENIMLQVRNLLESETGVCKFAKGFINIDIIKHKEGRITLIKDTVEEKKEYTLTKIATLNG